MESWALYMVCARDSRSLASFSTKDRPFEPDFDHEFERGFFCIGEYANGFGVYFGGLEIVCAYQNDTLGRS